MPIQSWGKSGLFWAENRLFWPYLLIYGLKFVLSIIYINIKGQTQSYLPKVGTLGTDPYRYIFLTNREKFQKKCKFKRIKYMFILRNSQWEGSFQVGKELPGEK